MKTIVTVSVIDDNELSVGTYSMYADQSAMNAVLFDFNPSADARVSFIKGAHAGLIAAMRNVQAEGDPAKSRAAAIAITELEGTQMRAVKALFAKG